MTRSYPFRAFIGFCLVLLENICKTSLSLMCPFTCFVSAKDRIIDTANSMFTLYCVEPGHTPDAGASDLVYVVCTNLSVRMLFFFFINSPGVNMRYCDQLSSTNRDYFRTDLRSSQL